MRTIIPIILVLISVALFVLYTNPAYQGSGACNPSATPSSLDGCGIKDFKSLSDQYNSALTNSRKLQEERDALATKYAAISPDDLTRLSKLLPDNSDDIRLIIDIQDMAQTYGMSLSAIKFDPTTDASTPAGQLAAGTPAGVAGANADYGIFNLEFSTTATYPNFLSFLHDIETSLRLTDIESIDFSSDDPTRSTYIFTVKLQTYWLKQ